MCVLILDTFNGCSSSIKEKCQSFTIQKNWGSQNVDFLEDEIWKNFEEQTSTRYIWGNVYIGIILTVYLEEHLHWHNRLQLSFVREIKDFYQCSFGNEVDFMDIMKVFLNSLAKY